MMTPLNRRLTNLNVAYGALTSQLADLDRRIRLYALELRTQTMDDDDYCRLAYFTKTRCETKRQQDEINRERLELLELKAPPVKTDKGERSIAG